MTKISFEKFAQLSKEEQEVKFNELTRENQMYYTWWLNDRKKVENLEDNLKELEEALVTTVKSHNDVVKEKNELIVRLCSVRNSEELNSIKDEIIKDFLLNGKQEEGAEVAPFEDEE